MRQEYSTDLTDEQWAIIAPLFKGMRNRKLDKRELVNAVLYLVDNGCKWQNFPHDFECPQFLSTCKNQRALGDKILQHFVEVTREMAGKNLKLKVHRANLHDTKAGIFPVVKAFRFASP